MDDDVRRQQKVEFFQKELQTMVSKIPKLVNSHFEK